MIILRSLQTCVKLNGVSRRTLSFGDLFVQKIHCFRSLGVRNELLHGVAGGEEKNNYKHDSHSNNRHDRKESLQEKCLKNGFTFAFLGISLESFFGKKDEEKTLNQESPLILMIKEGIIAFHEKEYEKSEMLLHVALKAAQDLEDEQSVTYIFDILANLALQLGDHRKAEELFRSVLQRHAAAGGDVYGNVFVALSLKLAQCYLARGAVEEAIRGYHYCIAAQKEKVTSDEGADEDTRVLYAMSLEQYARLLHSIGRYELARTHLQEALGVCVSINGPHHLQTAVLKNDIGSLYAQEKRYQEAAEEIEEAIAAVRRVISNEAGEVAQGNPPAPRKLNVIPDPRQPSAATNLATYLINLGTVELLRGRREAARRSCEEGVKLARGAGDGETQREAQSCLDAVKRAAKQAQEQAASV
ncbi:tetratricopeptide repeat protein 19 homolog, mitochondrial-like [Hyalella azteca]|uniref:Tetratricopeptide repeat protein 19 homolog, mitochondrial-like n=1 Tax=Hyalella azteca TaxID=294128 RepID=A0A8B7PKW8_HYAAZ|nr:tetratricopeptide repeat protein 19 homolog, mitochondrial-like [Hyalella azteca]